MAANGSYIVAELKDVPVKKTEPGVENEKAIEELANQPRGNKFIFLHSSTMGVK